MTSRQKSPWTDPPPFMNDAEIDVLIDQHTIPEPNTDETQKATIEEFHEYEPIISCAVFPALMLIVAIQILLSTVDAPRWVMSFVVGLFFTLPLGAFTVWSWNKAALTLPSGLTLHRSSLRMYALGTWVIVFILAVLWAWP